MALEEVVRRVTGGRKEFVNIALIEDRHTGSFRGMAFVNFHSTADATAALGELSKMVINKRKVIAEYRRLKPGEKEKKEAYEKRAASRFEHYNGNRQTFEKDITDETDENGNAVDKRAAFFAKRETVRKVDEQKRADERAERDKEREAEFRAKLLEYKNAEMPENAEIEELVFDSTLNSHDRRKVHTICEELELGHISRFDDEGNRVLHVSKDPEKKAEWDAASAVQKAAHTAAKKEANKRKNKEPRNPPLRKNAEPVPGGALSKEELQGIKWFKPRAAQATEDGKEEASNDGGIRAPSYKLYTPPRQPTGPDGTIGFTSRSRGEDDDANGADATDNNDEAVEESGLMNEDAEAEEGNAGKNEGERAKEDDDEKQSKKEAGGSDEKKSKHTVLNPSVPAFSPSSTQSF